MTYQNAAQQALDVQDACNLSGVVFAFNDAMRAVCSQSHEVNQGTDWRNRHPIVTMHLLKLSEMNGCDTTLNPAYETAETLCKRIAAGETGAY